MYIESALLFQTVHIWLGGLFTPEAYITATRQYVAQANNWSLEELYLDVSITCMYLVEEPHSFTCCLIFIVQVHVDFKGKLNDCSFGVTGGDVCVCVCVCVFEFEEKRREN